MNHRTLLLLTCMFLFTVGCAPPPQPGADAALRREGRRTRDVGSGVERVEQLDAATLSRLNQGRHKALAELHRPGLVAWGRWAAAAGVAAAAVVAASKGLAHPNPTRKRGL